MYKLSKNKEEELKEAEFHKSRIAFMIIDGNIMFLQNSPLTHYEWATQIGADLKKFDKITRGFIANNEIFFYQANFEVNEDVISDAKKFYPLICEKFQLQSPPAYGGMIIGEIGTRWQPKVKIC